MSCTDREHRWVEGSAEGGCIGDSVYARKTWHCWSPWQCSLPALAPDLPLLRLRSVCGGWVALPSSPAF